MEKALTNAVVEKKQLPKVCHCEQFSDHCFFVENVMVMVSRRRPINYLQPKNSVSYLLQQCDL